MADCNPAAKSDSPAGPAGLDGPTTGLAPGFVQGNLAILPRDWAGDRPQKRPIRGNLREDLGCAMIT